MLLQLCSCAMTHFEIIAHFEITEVLCNNFLPHFEVNIFLLLFTCYSLLGLLIEAIKTILSLFCEKISFAEKHSQAKTN